MTTKDNFAFVNSYLQKVSPQIRNNHGLIVKFLGDGVMAVFPEGADDALASGVAMFRVVEDFNQERLQKGDEPIKIGIGIHVGHIMLGIIGEANRMQGDAFSDHVNLTARLEGLTKFYGVSLLISQQAFENLTNPESYQLRFLDRAIVKGRKEPLAIYEVLDAEAEAVRDLKLKTLPDFEQGLEFFTNKEALAKAKVCFEKVLSVNSNDKTALLYLERLEILSKKGVPENWNGVWTFTEK